MRSWIIILTIAAVFTTNAAYGAAEKPVESAAHSLSIGAGMLASNGVYQGLSGKVLPLPVLTYRSPTLNVLGPTVSYTLVRWQGISLAPCLEYRWLGYSADKSEALSGMSDRRGTLEGGLEAVFRLRYCQVSARLLGDMLAVHDGREMNCSIKTRLSLGKWFFIPDSGLLWSDRRVADYYYGVRWEEAGPLRPAYALGQQWQWYGGLWTGYSLGDHWRLFVAGQYMTLTDRMRASPIVRAKDRTTLVIGTLYSF